MSRPSRKAFCDLEIFRTADPSSPELPLSYDDPSQKGKGPSTPSQTAWALMALFAAGDHGSESVRRGISYLLKAQEYDGSWKDAHWTGTGFPKVFYLRYHLYATYFPLWAISLFSEREDDAASRAVPRSAGRPAGSPAWKG